MGRAAAYNPRTGTYARGAAAYGPYQARGFAEAYNPRTDTYARTRQGSSAYSRWGSTGVSRGDDWVRTGHYRDSSGGIAGYQTSRGGSGFVAREGNNLYAGRDGNIYRNDGGSWQKYDNGNWDKVERPHNLDLSEARSAGNLSERRSGAGSTAANRNRNMPSQQMRDEANRALMEQLNRDARARSNGARRTSDYRSWNRSGRMRSGMGGFRGGGRRR